MCIFLTHLPISKIKFQFNFSSQHLQVNTIFIPNSHLLRISLKQSLPSAITYWLVVSNAQYTFLIFDCSTLSEWSKTDEVGKYLTHNRREVMHWFHQILTLIQRWGNVGGWSRSGTVGTHKYILWMIFVKCWICLYQRMCIISLPYI